MKSPKGHSRQRPAMPFDIIVFATGFDAMTGPLKMNLKAAAACG
jgi:hypothetical protein